VGARQTRTRADDAWLAPGVKSHRRAGAMRLSRGTFV